MLDATDIVRLVGESIALKPKGREFVCLCPFHNDHAPSMCVVPAKQIYHCFSCGAGGNAIDFAMNYHKMPFREALEYLANRSGIELTPWQRLGGGGGGVAGDRGGTSDAGGTVGRTEVLEANAHGSAFFRETLKHAERGRAARELIERRGISAEMVEAFELGASPEGWDGLVNALSVTGTRAGTRAGSGAGVRAVTWGSGGAIKVDVMVLAGLVKARASGDGHFDMFRNRLMFPIHDQAGRVIAFGARRIDDAEEPKYLNSPESIVFNKSATLYGLHQAARAIHASRTAIVTEGYMDTIACHQAGVKNAVATLGTALTESNARILRRLCDTVYLLFDGDAAGVKAAERAVRVFFAEPVDVRIAVLASATDAKDPDELLKRPDGREVLDRVLANAMDPLDVLFRGVRERIGGGGLSATARIVEEFIATLADLGISRLDPMRRQMVAKRLAQIAGVDQQMISTLIASKGSGRRAGVASMVVSGAEGPDQAEGGARDAVRMGAAEHLLGCVLCDPTLLLSLDLEHADALEPDAFEDGRVRGVARAVHELFVSEEAATLSNVLSTLEDAEARRAAVTLARTVETITEGSAERLHGHWNERLGVVLRQRLKSLAMGKASGAANGENASEVLEGSVGEVGASRSVAKQAHEEEEWLRAMQILRERSATLGTDQTALPRTGA